MSVMLNQERGLFAKKKTSRRGYFGKKPVGLKLLTLLTSLLPGVFFAPRWGTVNNVDKGNWGNAKKVNNVKSNCGLFGREATGLNIVDMINMSQLEAKSASDRERLIMLNSVIPE